MNSFRLGFNSLTAKFFILLLACFFQNFKGLAQQSADTCYVNILYDSSRVYYTVGDYRNAIKNLNRILLLKSKMPDDSKPEYFKVYNLLGVVYRRQGDLSRAIDFYKKAIENTSESYYLSVINGNIANIYSLKGDYSKSIYYIENTLSVLEKSDDVKKYRYMADNYHNLGYAYRKLGDYNLARVNYLKSIQLAEKNQLGGVGETYYNCGLTYQKLDSLNRADYCFKKAIAYNTKEFGENHYMTGMAYMNYAAFYSDIGDYRNSSKLYKKSLDILLKTLGDKHSYTSLCLKNIGLLHYRLKQRKQALSYFQKSLIAKTNSFNDSSVYANPSVDVIPDMDLLDILKLKAQAFERLAEHESRAENLKAALATLELATTFIERLRTGYLYEGSKLQLAEREHEVYLAIVRISYSLYEITRDYTYTEIAFRYAEYSKYAILRELKNDEMAKGVAGVPDSISDSERNLKQQIASLRMQVEDESKLERPSIPKIDGWNKQLFTLTQKIEGLMQRLESNYPAYYRQKYSNQVVGIPQLQRTMDKKEAILEYVLGNDELYTFTITRDTFLLLRQEVDSTFGSNLNLFTASLQSEYSYGHTVYKNAAYALYQKLIYPVEPLLKNRNLLIIPDGGLSLIPFDALIDKPHRDGERIDYTQESFLLRRYAIGYAFSATLYSNALNGTGNGSPSFIGIAPDYKNSTMRTKNIPKGLRSVRMIALLTFGKSLTGGSATKENFKKYGSRYDIIHFYAHGFDDTLNPANSKLALAAPTDSAEDGYLHAWEVYNMQLNAQMVVLGACNSGSGRLSKGEGVLSISRSFMYAGSQSVVISLWAAAVVPTNDILNNFYLNLLKGMRKDEALRLAKLNYLESVDPIDAHPCYWAGIVVNGNQNGLYHHWYLKRIVAVIVLISLLFLVYRKRKAIKGLIGRIRNSL